MSHVADLPHADGSNGNGITAAIELLQYMSAHLLANHDDGFKTSYEALLVPHSATALVVWRGARPRVPRQDAADEAMQARRPHIHSQLSSEARAED